MPPPLPTDPLEIRTFIRYDALLEKPISKGFEDLCRILPQYDYSEYKFYHDHFSAGSLDLNVVYHQSADPTPLSLQDFPVELLEKILEPLHVKNRFKLRLVSRRMLAVVDQLQTHYDTIDITCWDHSVNVVVWFDNSSWTAKTWSEESARENVLEIALLLKTILKPTNIRVKNFQILSRHSDLLKPIVDLVVLISNSENSKFHVKSAVIAIQDRKIAQTVLSVLKPKILEHLSIGRNPGATQYTAFVMEELKEMQQFKQAKTVDVIEFILSTDLVYFSNFEKFNVEVHSMEPDDFICLRNDLSKPDNTIFRSCTIHPIFRYKSIAEISRILGEYFPNEETLLVKHCCSIENSKKVLQFVIRNYSIVVEKGDPIELAEKYRDEEESHDDSEDFGDDDSDFDGELGDDEELISSDDDN